MEEKTEIEIIFERERKARKEAEKKLEEFSYKLYYSYQEIEKLNLRLKEEIKHKDKIIELLNVFTSRLNNHNTLKGILNEIIDTIICNLDFEDCVVYLVDHESGYLYQEASYGDKRSDNGEVVAPIKIKIGEGITGKVAKTGKARIVRDTSKVPEYICDDVFRYSELAVPVFGTDKKVIGVIDLEHSEKDYFTVEHLNILNTIANICSSHLLQSTLSIKLENEKLKNREKEFEYETILESVHECIIIIDVDGRIMYVNSYLKSLVGYSFEEIKGTHFLEYLAPKLRRSFVHKLLSFIKSRKDIISFETCILSRSGEEIWLDINLTTNGKRKIHSNTPINSYTVFGRNITDLRQERNAQLHQRNKYRNIISNMNLGLLEVDRNENILFANESFCDMSGYYVSELIGRNGKDLLLHPDSMQTMEIQNENRFRGVSGSYEVKIINKKGEERYWLISGAPNYDNNNELIGTIGVHLDVTESKKIQNELLISKLEAEHARDVEKDFLANMSHEIRNPLNSILGLTALLHDTPLTLQQKELLANITFSSQILKSLVKDILDVSKLIDGEKSIEREKFILFDLMEGHRRITQYKLQDDDIKFEYYFDKNLPECIYGDPNIINQVISNLLDNAVKFTNKGAIRFSIYLDSLTNDVCNISFVIEDSGIGIIKEHQNLIFERFAQAGKVSTNHSTGSGLGLFITKELIELMHGTITLESEFGIGSKFIVKLPLMACSKDELELSPLSIFESKSNDKVLRALVVEDNEINIKYLEVLLAKHHISYHSCYNGKEAISYLNSNTYDFILLDIRMPIMDGYETTLWLRSQKSNSNCKTPIIALTASALLDDKEKIISIGANFHLSKPYAEVQLIEAINSVLETQINSDPFLRQQLFMGLKLDIDQIEDIYGSDYKQFLIMLELFEKSMLEESGLLDKSNLAKDLRSIKNIAHKIKPNFRLVGLSDYENCISKLEDVSSLEELKIVFPVVMKRIKEAIKKVQKVSAHLKQILFSKDEMYNS